MYSPASIKKTLIILSVILLYICLSTLCFLPSAASAETSDTGHEPKWTIHFRPGIRVGTDDRTLYIMDFLIPLYQDEKNILFATPKFTPNDLDGWEVNLGLGYRRVLLDNRLMFGVNGFYDQRKMFWGTRYEQWGLGAEVMAEVPLGNVDIGLTGRFNYYHPLTDPKLQKGKGVKSPFDSYCFL